MIFEVEVVLGRLSGGGETAWVSSALTSLSASLEGTALSVALLFGAGRVASWATPSWICLMPARVLTRPLMASTEADNSECSCLSDLTDERISWSIAIVSGGVVPLVAILMDCLWTCEFQDRSEV